ncbi:NADH:flavin oxidoreductase/NADH oxidase family protein [Carpediemonas membranifera]|uniref:NADH:flavin oxidoreductase/NADH oxidase family protein n=1 Tax=Carpediemonas membranifera TaxID=201153 RepID=A0A8J6BZ30_9EUKA|nr:NADH:flavin oxidoreductase/NADH oxidase family protein [Carpediemonas membranifera]|eukprot:KAG9395136.1 NADH:flavin oxidoreductase/NADH oxidase family protein [Carpediemonas membranifera]
MSVWKSIEINKLTLHNRWIRSATWEAMATPKGGATRELVAWYDTLAQGGLGLIIASHAFVTENGRVKDVQLSLANDKIAAEHKKIVDASHIHGSAIMAQLTHGGYASITDSPKTICSLPDDLTLRATVKMPIEAEEYTIEELEALEDAFAAAAARCKRIAGYDGVQFHAGHGYLISTTLSPAVNRRPDRYGKDRALFLRNIVAKARALVGPDFPLAVKINGSDYFDIDGRPVGSTVQTTIDALSSIPGLDAVEVSGGVKYGAYQAIRKGNFFPLDKQGYHRNETKAIRDALAPLGVTVIAVGGIRTPSGADRLIDSGVCDAVAMCRPFIAEPHIVKLMMQNHDLTRVKCVSCSRCIEAMSSPGVIVACQQCMRDQMKT